MFGDECGFDASPRGRLGFHEYTLSRLTAARDPVLSGHRSREARRMARLLFGSPVEVTGPAVEAAGGVRRVILSAAGAPMRCRWDGDAAEVLAAGAERCGVDAGAMRARCKVRRVTAARRVVLWCWVRELGRAQCEIAPVLGLSASTASEQLGSTKVAEVEVARRVARELWEARPFAVDEQAA